MAAFSAEEAEGQWDYELLYDGPVSGFSNEEQLDHVLGQLRHLGYGIAETRGGTDAPLLQRLLDQVSMQYCGWSVKNLDAFCDTLRYIDFKSVTGWALVIRQFDEQYDADPQLARQLAHVLAQVSYEHLLRGNRLLTLVHSENRELALGRLGGHEPWWRGSTKDQG
jgi:hypothetical protein